ncbi:MAG: hypothetical protein ACYC41_14415 [Bacillota bacterium]
MRATLNQELRMRQTGRPLGLILALVLAALAASVIPSGCRTSPSEPASEVLLSVVGLAPDVSVVIDGTPQRPSGPQKDCISVQASKSGEWPRVWLASPLKEPKEITTAIGKAAARGRIETVDLSRLAKGMRARPIPVTGGAWLKTIGPYTTAPSLWIGARTFGIMPAAVQVDTGRAAATDGVRWPPAVSPDGGRVAFVSDAAIVIRDLSTGRDTRYDLTTITGPTPETTLLAWSPTSTRPR